jgi:hypothetical protein
LRIVRKYRRPPNPKKAESRKVSQKDKEARIEKMRNIYGIQPQKQESPPKPTTLTYPNLQKLNNLSNSTNPITEVKCSSKYSALPNISIKNEVHNKNAEEKFNNPSTQLNTNNGKDIVEEIEEKEVNGLLEWVKELPEEISSSCQNK